MYTIKTNNLSFDVIVHNEGLTAEIDFFESIEGYKRNNYNYFDSTDIYSITKTEYKQIDDLNIINSFTLKIIEKLKFSEEIDYSINYIKNNDNITYFNIKLMKNNIYDHKFEEEKIKKIVIETWKKFF